MNSIKITVISDRSFQQKLEAELIELVPQIKTEIALRKALGAMQITTLVIASADLLVNVLNLLIAIKKDNPVPSSRIRIESNDRKLEIDTIQKLNSADITKIVGKFFKNG
ncbi:hypothetical protein KKB83_03135 [Patescibacteria group bacterium]|nr:hypothetical protein [Patescibacteria group bacterium]